MQKQTLLFMVDLQGQGKFALYDGSENEAERALQRTFVKVVPLTLKTSSVAKGVVIRDAEGKPVFEREPFPVLVNTAGVLLVRLGAGAMTMTGIKVVPEGTPEEFDPASTVQGAELTGGGDE